MKVHNFFPLSILQDQIKLTDEEKFNLVNDIRKMKNNSQIPKFQILKKVIIRIFNKLIIVQKKVK